MGRGEERRGGGGFECIEDGEATWTKASDDI